MVGWWLVVKEDDAINNILAICDGHVMFFV